MKTVKEKQKEVFEKFKEKFGHKNQMSSPTIEKVVVSCGTGSMIKVNNDKNDLVSNRLSKITGQKPSIRQAKKSIAAFKTREGNPIGQSVTLRGARMWGFLDKLLNIAIPRIRDFRGIKKTAIDDMGNLTIGIKEHTIFPETSDEDLRDVFSLAITIVTTASSKEEAEAFFEEIGMPFKKEE